MAKNGLFADDGRVQELAQAIKMRFMGVANDISGVNARHDSLTTRVDDHDTALANVARDLGLTNAELASLTGLINAKATRAEQNDLTARLDALPTPEGLSLSLATLAQGIEGVDGRVGEVAQQTLPVFGKLAKVDGFQTLATGTVDTNWAQIRMAQDFVTGGFEYINENGGMLKIPVDGYYLIIVNAYFSGPSSWMGSMRATIYSTNGARSHPMGNAMAWKPNGMDLTISRSEVGYFGQGQAVCVEGTSARGDGSENVSTQATWGDQQRIGTTLMAIKL